MRVALEDIFNLGGHFLHEHFPPTSPGSPSKGKYLQKNRSFLPWRCTYICGSAKKEYDHHESAQALAGSRSNPTTLLPRIAEHPIVHLGINASMASFTPLAPIASQQRWVTALRRGTSWRVICLSGSLPCRPVDSGTFIETTTRKTTCIIKDVPHDETFCPPA